jgi:uncharacterized membrane protein YeaQ/YmgE (transglycosylase-associated protein family)
MWTIVVWTLLGAAAGLFARFLIPGRDGLRVPATIALGLAGAVGGGLLSNVLWGATLLDLGAAAIAGASVGAVSMLLASRSLRREPD